MKNYVPCKKIGVPIDDVSLSYVPKTGFPEYQPQLDGLPENAVIKLLAKDTKPHGEFVVIYEIELESFIIYGTGKAFKTQPYDYQPGPHRPTQVIELDIGQIIYNPDRPDMTKINGRTMTVYKIQKKPR